jgi:hypothetical protein
VRIAREGIYGLGQFVREVVTPVLELWDVDHLPRLSREAEGARTDLHQVVARLAASVDRIANKTPPGMVAG